MLTRIRKLRYIPRNLRQTASQLNIKFQFMHENDERLDSKVVYISHRVAANKTAKTIFLLRSDLPKKYIGQLACDVQAAIDLITS